MKIIIINKNLPINMDFIISEKQALRHSDPAYAGWQVCERQLIQITHENYLK